MANILQVFSDPHVGSITQSRLDALTNDRPLTPAAVICCGDITEAANGAQDTAALAFLNGLGTWYAVNGGHDVLGRTPDEWAAAYGMEGRDYYVEIGSPAFVRLIVLGVVDASSVTLDATALANLETWVTGTSLPVIIATHPPMYNTVINTDLTNYYSSDQPNWFLNNQAAIWQIAADNDNVKMFLSGHIHASYTSTRFLHSEQIGTHLVHFIPGSSIYYTNKVTGEDLTEAVVSQYLTFTDTTVTVQLRDHLNGVYLDEQVLQLSTGLAEKAYHLLDVFDAANDTTPNAAGYRFRQCDGNGSLDIYDTNAIMSIAGGRFVANGTPGSVNGWMGQRPVERKCGRALHIDLVDKTTVSATNFCWGFSSTRHSSRVYQIGIGYRSATSIDVRGADGSVIFADSAAVLTSVPIQFKCIMRGTGGIVLARDANMAANTWRIYYVFGSNSDDLYVKWNLSSSVACNVSIDNVSVSDLVGGWATDFGMAEEYAATTTDGQMWAAASGDFLVEHTITAQTDVTQEIMFRRTDDDNTWIVRMDQAGSTISLISKTGGVETVRSTAAKTWTNGTKYRIVIIAEGSTERVVIDDDDASITAASTSFQNTVTGVKVSHAGETFAIWPRTLTITEYPAAGTVAVSDAAVYAVATTDSAVYSVTATDAEI